jgi:cytochrome c553
MKHSLLLLSLLTAATAALAAEQAQPAPQGDPAKGQPIAATVCAACHGPDGNSIPPAGPAATFPKLAGQHADYLFKQMSDFKPQNGKPPVRTNAIMNGMVAAFDAAQMRDIAAWFAAQAQKSGPAPAPADQELGQKLFRAGDQAKGLPACAGCHGPAGAGIPGQFPRIGGQWADYLQIQLKAFRAGDRANDPSKTMRTIALRMTDPEIKAVADYAAGLRSEAR